MSKTQKKSATNNLLKLIKELSESEIDFKSAGELIEKFVNGQDKDGIIELVRFIGILPEAIKASSSQEKLFSKAGDIILAKSFRLLNLNAKPLEQRGNAGDVLALSIEFNYGIIADAKSFRLSRTAKNQKDFKVKALSEWREDKDYAVLVAPFFQYPSDTSQIYKQSLDENVLLFSWEHLSIMLQLNLSETSSLSLEQLWNFPLKHRKRTTVENANKNFMSDFNLYFMDLFKLEKEQLQELLQIEISKIKERSISEIDYWENQIERIKSFSRFKRRGKPLNGWSEADKLRPVEYQNWVSSWAGEWERVVKPGGSVFVFAGRQFSHRVTVAFEEAGFTFKDMLSWERDKAPHRAQRLSKVYERRGDVDNEEKWSGWRVANLRPMFEPILWFQKPYKTGGTIADNVLENGVGAWNEQSLVKWNKNQNSLNQSNVIKVDVLADDRKYHTTQKPLNLMKLLVELVTVEQQIVLDPFAGSGTTLLAAKELNRRYIGYEKDFNIYKIGEKRLEHPSF